MAELTTTERTRLHVGIMRLVSQSGMSTNLTKPQLYQALAALDTWIEANQAAINSALPAAARAESVELKTLIFCAIALMRVSETFARRILEVD